MSRGPEHGKRSKPTEVGQSGFRSFTKATMPNRFDFPYKVANFDPETNQYKVITTRSSFAEAYNHPSGTHVIQTHGTSAEVEQQARGASSSPRRKVQMLANAPKSDFCWAASPGRP